jgi:hypothetical protein
MELHVNALHSFGGNADGASIIRVHGYCWLRISYIGEDSAEHGTLATVDNACVVGIATEQRALICSSIGYVTESIRNFPPSYGGRRLNISQIIS